MRRMVLGVALAALTQPALAAGCAAPDAGMGLATADVARLMHLEASRAKGIDAARSSEVAAERKLVTALFDAGTEVPDPKALAGNYQCRTIKLGGITPLVVYGWFKCRISASGGGLTLEKVSGSQNFTGALLPAGEGLIFKGAEHYGYEGKRAYGDDPERDEVGCLVALSDKRGHLLLELPEPKLESFHDVIELRTTK